MEQNYIIENQTPNSFFFKHIAGQAKWTVKIELRNNGKENYLVLIIDVSDSSDVRKIIHLQLMSKYHVGAFIAHYNEYNHFKEFALKEKGDNWVNWRNKSVKYMENAFPNQMRSALQPVPLWEVINRTGWVDLLLQKLS